MCISAQYYVSRLQSPLSLNWLRRLCGLRERLEIRPRRGYVVDTVIVVVVVAAIVRDATVAGGRCVGVEAGVRVRQDRRQRRPLDDLLRDSFHRRGRSTPRRDTFSASLPSSELGSGELAAISRRGHYGVMLLRVTFCLVLQLVLSAEVLWVTVRYSRPSDTVRRGRRGRRNMCANDSWPRAKKLLDACSRERKNVQFGEEKNRAV